MTLVVGIITTIVACFPFVFTGLLNFVGIYGLLLVPAGAIVMAEHWLFPPAGAHAILGSRARSAAQLAGPHRLGGGNGARAGSVPDGKRCICSSCLRRCTLLTVVVYVILAAIAGARTHRARAPVERDAGQGGRPGPARDEHKPAPASQTNQAIVSWMSGLVALAALIVCVALAVHVYGASAGDYADCLAWFRRWLIVPTLVYFVAATTWQVRRMRARAQ